MKRKIRLKIENSYGQLTLIGVRSIGVAAGQCTTKVVVLNDKKSFFTMRKKNTIVLLCSDRQDCRFLSFFSLRLLPNVDFSIVTYCFLLASLLDPEENKNKMSKSKYFRSSNFFQCLNFVVIIFLSFVHRRSRRWTSRPRRHFTCAFRSRKIFRQCHFHRFDIEWIWTTLTKIIRHTSIRKIRIIERT